MDSPTLARYMSSSQCSIKDRAAFLCEYKYAHLWCITIVISIVDINDTLSEFYSLIELKSDGFQDFFVVDAIIVMHYWKGRCVIAREHCVIFNNTLKS